ncbi:hypothetical protein ABAC460_18770 [Asticcacaulis sp. AC460]|uniref:acetyltransferase n=1 Tax=Asticcacaulis sp. AC460 TaxID=1282360 RepID=UPI0003C3F497|nr:acetyltransferase [Asticcacaulis sp. AC460]ESQ87718.1 hypothetical protein ABAC460_18770 [Asticcacaulis sp. AC460]
MILRKVRDSDRLGLFDVWRTSVKATHHFLTQQDFENIAALVADHYLAVADLWLVVDADDLAIAFMGLTDNSLDSLFVSPAHTGRGIGRRLTEHAASLAGPLIVDVNEQNSQAVGFYERMGFRVTGRSDRDNDGRPYPLLHMAQ